MFVGTPRVGSPLGPWGAWEMNEPGTAVALVLAGGGARGAYEVGALSVLLPELERRNQRPRIFLGTSVGALNAGFFAAQAHLPAAELVPKALSIWEAVQWGQVARSPMSGSSLRRVWQSLCQMLGMHGERASSLLDSGPLHRTLRGWVEFAQIEDNVEARDVDVGGVVATSVLTGRSVVFHCGGASPPSDHRRGIDYVATPLLEDHVLASSAIPAAFPAVHVTAPERARGWYSDGGTRLNTPIRPALDFGADRVVLVALNTVAAGPALPLAGPDQPDALVGIGQVLTAMFTDQLVADVQTLATVNRLLGGAAAYAGSAERSGRTVPYIVVAPQQRDAIAQLALEVVREHYSGAGRALSHPDIAMLARVVDGDADVRHADLLSLLLFTPEFSRALIRLGQEDARHWMQTPHDLDDLWQVGPLPPATAGGRDAAPGDSRMP
jgi:NTE family protein